MNRKKFIYITIIIILIIYLLKNNIIIVIPKNKEVTIGIIDFGNVNNKNKLLGCYCNDSYLFGHGNEMVEFAYLYNEDLNIFYYDATIDGKIKDSEIANGIKWMMDRGVNIINISLSSKKNSEILLNTINEFIDRGGIIFASYNNKKSTYDFPAQYDRVKGIGKKEVLKTKEEDRLFNTNKIIIFNKSFKIYEGNSYLSIIETINYAIRGENEK